MRRCTCHTVTRAAAKATRPAQCPQGELLARLLPLDRRNHAVTPRLFVIRAMHSGNDDGWSTTLARMCVRVYHWGSGRGNYKPRESAFAIETRHTRQSSTSRVAVYWSLNVGFRLPMNAAMPSFWSSCTTTSHTVHAHWTTPHPGETTALVTPSHAPSRTWSGTCVARGEHPQPGHSSPRSST